MFFYDSTISLFFELKNEIVLIYFLVINFFLLSLGIIDDKLSIQPLSKTFISLIIFIFFLILNKDFQIIKLKFESFDKEIDLVAEDILPMITWGTSPDLLEYV